MQFDKLQLFQVSVYPSSIVTVLEDNVKGMKDSWEPDEKTQDKINPEWRGSTFLDVDSNWRQDDGNKHIDD